jgi:tRNA(Ile2) C34 agmatinyltransferase TiaS
VSTTLVATRAPSLFDGPGGEPTLDDMIVSVWEGLTAHRSVTCPLCGSEMKPEYGSHARPLGGRCLNCGTTLS